MIISFVHALLPALLGRECRRKYVVTFFWCSFGSEILTFIGVAKWITNMTNRIFFLKNNFFVLFYFSILETAQGE